jgi:hypothetical protein
MATKNTGMSKLLDECENYSCIFALVKSAVESAIGSRRAGLSMATAELPLNIGALHQIGSNFIIVNRVLLDHVLDACDRRTANAYVFHVLLHEYVHSLGFADERETEGIVRGVTELALGRDHPASDIATRGIGSLISRIGVPAGTVSQHPSVGTISIVDDLETENLNYFG